MAPKLAPTLIVAIGDSTTAGTPGFLSPLEAPPHGAGDVRSQFAYWLMQMHDDWRVLNRGVNGDRSDQIRARFRRDALDAQPDLVVIIAGVNDVYQGRAPETVERELELMYALARPMGIPIVAGSILPYNTATHTENDRMRAVNEWVREYTSRDANVTFCDTRSAVASPGDPDRLGSSPDGLHPSVEGYRLMAVTLEPVIAPIVTSRHR